MAGSDIKDVTDIPSATKIVVLRHAQSLGNKKNTIQGRKNYSLSDEGRAQAEAAAQCVSAWNVESFVASELSRARETAEILAGGKSVHSDPRLSERDAGAWAGQSRTTLEAAHPGVLEPGSMRPDDFESDALVFERMHAVMSELATRTGLVVVVSHGAAMRVLDCRLGGPGERYANLSGMFISDKLDFLGRIDDFSG